MTDCKTHHFKSSSSPCPTCEIERHQQTLVRMQRRYAFARQTIDEIEVLCATVSGKDLSVDVVAVIDRYRKEIEDAK